MGRPVSRDAERAERWRGWMARAQDGDGEAYALLLAELLPFVRRAVRGALRDDPGVDDVVQETLLSIHRARSSHQRGRALEPWVRAIARNAVIDHVRRRTRLASRASEVDAAEMPGPNSDPLRGRLSPGLERALDRLPNAQRQAVTLLKLEGLSVSDAAERAGTTEGALKLRAHRGYRALREALGRKDSS